MELRPYQENALNSIRAHYANGVKKVLLHLATGGGKTLIFCTVLKSAHQRGKKAIMVVRGKNLVDQASQRLEREGVDHGVIMSGHWRNRPLLPIQICSIDTLYSRRDRLLLDEIDLIVIDEAHLAGSNAFHWLVDTYPDCFYLPVSATPHVKKGLRHVADEVVYPIGVRELIAQGFLVKPEYYAPAKPDLSRVKIDSKTGDYQMNQLSAAMEQVNLYGDMAESYRRYADGLPGLVFCVSVEHSQQVCAMFNSLGIVTDHMDGTMPPKVRAEKIKLLESGKVKVITSVGTLTTGVDIPCVQCIILARPTKSYNLYIQILGRGTRPYAGKSRFLVLDHSNAIEEHGFIENERSCDLDGKDTKNVTEPTITCKQCYHVWDPIEQYNELNNDYFNKTKRDYVCQMCGADMKPENVREEKERETDETYELRKISEDVINETPMQFQIRKLVKKCLQKHYKIGWVYHKAVEEFGEMQAKANFGFAKRVYNEILREMQ